MFLLTLSDIIISILDIVFLVLLLYIINYYTQGNNTQLFKDIFNHPLLPILLFFLLFSIKNYTGYQVYKKQFAFIYKVASRISKDKLEEYLTGNYINYVNTDSSVHNRKISQQPIEFSHHVLSGFQQIVSQVFLILLTMIGILIYNPILFPLLFLVLVPPILLVSMLVRKKLRSVRASGKIVSEKALQHLQEALDGYVESNLYQGNDFFTERYRKFQERFNQHLSQQLVIQNLPSRFLEVFAVFGLLMLITINSFLSHSSMVSIVTIAAFMAAAYKIIPGVVKILNSMGQIRTFTFTVSGILENKNQPKTNVPVDTISSIEFKDVYFKFKEQAILNNLSFSMNKGDMMGIGGNSGRGKTTIVNLLLGFLQPGQGNILINNIICDDNLGNYWNNIAYIKQEPFFIHDTIARNITFAENEFDEKKLSSVMKITGVDILAKRFKDNAETLITENGKNFSGGEKQRIQLARALYKEADLIILDEAFNELDEPSEIAMLTYLQSLAHTGKMILLITHNTAAFAFCNKKIDLS